MSWSPDWLAATEPSRSAAGTAAWNPCALEIPSVEEPTHVEVDHDSELSAAWQAGYDEGWAAAVASEAERLAGAYATLRAAADAAAVHVMPEELLREHVTVLALAVARHLIGRDVRGDSQVVADLVRRAVANFPLDESLRIRVHPHDLSAISTVGADGGPIRIAPGRDVQWIPDPDIEVGACVVEGRERIVDGRIDQALERIYRRLSDD